MTKRRRTDLLFSCLLGGTLACDSPPPAAMPAAPTVPMVAAPAPAPSPPPNLNTAIRPLSIGDRVTATLRTSDQHCAFDLDDLTAPCARFSVAPAQAGRLVIRLTWSNAAHFLQIVFPQSDSRGGITCCASPHVERLAVMPGTTYEFQVWFIGATYGPGGHTPPAAEQVFELATAFDP